MVTENSSVIESKQKVLDIIKMHVLSGGFFKVSCPNGITWVSEYVEELCDISEEDTVTCYLNGNTTTISPIHYNANTGKAESFMVERRFVI